VPGTIGDANNFASQPREVQMPKPEGIVDFTPSPKLFPFESRWFDSSVGPVHYIDEGSGRTILLLHGNPD